MRRDRLCTSNRLGSLMQDASEQDDHSLPGSWSFMDDTSSSLPAVPTRPVIDSSSRGAWVRLPLGFGVIRSGPGVTHNVVVIVKMRNI